MKISLLVWLIYSVIWWASCLGVTLKNPNLGLGLVFVGGFVYVLLGIFNFELMLKHRK